MALDAGRLAADTITRMQEAGFDAAQVDVGLSAQDELNIAHNAPSLLRSTEDQTMALIGIVDGRRASTTLTELDDASIARAVGELLDNARSSPQDDGNAVSAGEQGNFEQGPLQGDREILVAKVEEILSFRAERTPLMNIEEGAALHRVSRGRTMTSEGSDLAWTVGSYGLQVMGTASEGGRSSSFNGAGGRANEVAGVHACELFGIGEMLIETERQIDTRQVEGNFTGDVVLAPDAVSDLLGWLLRQLQDGALLAGASLYRERVGEQIAAPLLTISSRFDGPGCAPYSSDAFRTEPVELVREGRLGMLLPSLYGSRRTGLPHVPTTSGWRIQPGSTPRDELIGSVGRGALVNRLSMGSPGPNGDFSGVIKNSFLIEDGKVGQALSETMISGNMARMLEDISGISAEHLDGGSLDLPWIRIPGLHFS